MKEPARQVVIIVCSLALLVSCAKINLSGGKGAGGGNTATTSANPQPQTQPLSQASNSPPPVDGEWEVDYEFKGSPYIGSVTFAQSGTALSGAGADQDGKEWQVDAGSIQGTKVSFGKKYATSSSPPIQYTGELKFLQSPEYTGWAMEGSYSASSPDGKSITGNWVANPTNPAPAPEAAQAPAQQPATNPFFGGGQPAAPPPPKSSAPEHIGDARPTDISGHYDGSYNFNFKKVTTKMWLESDGNKVTGRGYDVMGAPAKAKGKKKGEDVGDGNEHFTIARGWYAYPDVTLLRQYTKGKGAKETRLVKFRAQISSNGRDIVMKGETQFGGTWDAHRL